MSWLSNIGKTIGKTLNDITGVSSSAKQQYKNQLKLQQQGQDFAKWQMGNAHQMEVQDLQAAGLNPVLSAGGSGASAGVTEGSASAGVGGNPIEMATSIIGAINNSKQTKANVENLEAQNNLADAQAYSLLTKANPEAEKALAERDNLVQQINESKDRQELIKAQEKLAAWEARHPLLSKVLGGLPSAASGIASAMVMGGSMKAINNIRANSTRTIVRNNYNARGNRTGTTVTTSR